MTVTMERPRLDGSSGVPIDPYFPETGGQDWEPHELRAPAYAGIRRFVMRVLCMMPLEVPAGLTPGFMSEHGNESFSGVLLPRSVKRNSSDGPHPLQPDWVDPKGHLG